MPSYAFTDKPNTTEFEAFTFVIPDKGDAQWEFIDTLNDTLDWLGVKANNFQFDGDKVIVVVERPKKEAVHNPLPLTENKDANSVCGGVRGS